MRKPWRNIIGALLCALLLCVSVAAEESEPVEAADTAETEPAEEIELPAPDDAPSQPEEKSSSDWISGRFTIDMDAAWAKGDHDIDLDQSLRLKLSPPSLPKLHFNTSLWLHQDLDGREANTSVLRDLNSAYSGDFHARLALLYMQVDDLWGASTLRLGRQRINESPIYPRIDGAFFQQRNAHWDWYAYIGARASLYRPDNNGLSTGAGITWRPTTRTRIALDAAYMEEDRRQSDVVRRGLLPRLLHWDYPNEVARDVDNTYLSLSLHQALTDNLWGHARFTLNDNGPDEVLLDLLGYAPNMDLTYNVSYRRQLRRAKDRTNDITVFYRSMGELETFDHFLATVHKQISPKLAFSLEGELHLTSSNNRYDNNRDYWRLAGMVMFSDIRPGLDLSIALERWDVEHKGGTWVITGELSKKWDKWRWNLGVDYEQYRDEVYHFNPTPQRLNQLAIFLIPGVFPRPFTPLIWASDTERVRTREEIWSVYTGAEYTLRENQKLTAKVTYEDDNSSQSPYWRVQAGYAIDF